MAAASAEYEGGGGIASASAGGCLPRSPGGVRSLVSARSSNRPGAASTWSVLTVVSLQASAWRRAKKVRGETEKG